MKLPELIRKTNATFSDPRAGVVSFLFGLVTGGQFSILRAGAGKGIALADYRTLQNGYKFAEQIFNLVGKDDEEFWKIERIVSNFNDELGEDLVNQSIYSFLLKADTEKRAQMYGSVIFELSRDVNVKNSFWEIMHVIETLPINDFEYLNDVRLSKHAKSINDRATVSAFSMNGRQVAYNSQNFSKHFTPARLMRFRSVGLAENIRLQGGNTETGFISELAELVWNCIGRHFIAKS